MQTVTDIILILINNTKERQSLQSFLEESGYQVQLTSTLDDAIPTYIKYSLIIFDFITAQENIKKLISIKQLLNHIFLPLLIMLPEEQGIAPWLQAGCDDVLRIPLRETELAARIKNLLTIRSQSFVYYHTCLEIGNDAVFILDEAYDIMDCNTMVPKLYGYTKEELIGKPLSYVKVPAECFKIAAQMQKVLEGSKETWEAVQLCKDGTTFIGEVSSKFLKSGDNHKFYHAVRDITERRRIEKDASLTTANLETQVKHRTLELQNINSELEAFSYSVAHDLRSPLRAIDGFSQAILDDYAQQLAPEGQDYFKRIRAATHRMGELIEALLTFSNLTRVSMKIERVCLSDIVQTLANDLHTSNPNRNVKFIIQQNVYANVDKVLIRIVLDNLLNNAFKFTSKHASGKIEFNVIKDKENNTIYCVRDDGAGFDMAYADKLFSPFQRLHRTAEFTGTGIGLATVQRILKRHGGSIWAEGMIEHGAIFNFTLGGNADER